MRNILIIIFLTITLSLQAATYYVATDGSDSNAGTISQPWLTIQKGFSSISAGDILYIRGGTYYPTGTSSGGMIAGAVANGKKGSASSMYNVLAYPGEVPVIDCRNISSTSYDRYGILLISSDYWYIKGIEITRVDQPSGHIGQGFLIMSGNNNKIEAVVSHHNGGPGLGLRDQSEGNLFLNCDSYSNYDPLSSTPGDDADGFDIGFITSRSGNDRVNTLQGCRSWLNSDDGFDMYQYPGYHGIYILKDCWAWKNGFRTDGVTAAGDGNGYKYGADNNYSLDAVVRRTSYNCVAYANRQRGFSQESANVKMIFYNCTAYKNGTWGFSFYDYDTPDVLRNNISYNNPNGTIENQGSNRTHDHNSWDSQVTLSDADFTSLDASQLANPRQSDGSLPVMTFLHLASTSDLIDAGVNVGLPYSGNAPDLGAFETGSTSTTTAPVFSSASVENAAPTILVMNYNQDFNSLVIPASSAFAVTVNSSARTINSVAISGSTVKLTLASAIQYGDVIKVAYTKPSSNPLQNAGGLQSESLSATSVTNNVSAPVPVFVSASVENAAPLVLSMVYSLSLANVVPSTSTFTVLVNSTRRSVSSVAISGTKVLLTLASAVVSGDVVTVAYTKPSSNPLQTSSGGQAASISAKTVTNNVASSIPVYVSSSIQNSAPGVVVITYNMSLASVVPAASAFTVNVNAVKVTISSVAVSGTYVSLTLANTVAGGDVVTLSYTKPSKNPVQSVAGSQAASLSSVSVTNNVVSIAPVYVSSSVEDATPKLLEMTYNMTLSTVTPSASAFTVTVNSSKRTVSSVTISGSKVQLNLNSAVVYGDVITVAYAKPSTNPLQSVSGTAAASLSATGVTNNVTTDIPELASASVENDTPNVIVLNYNMTLSAGSVPSASAFTVMVSAALRSVNSVTISGSHIFLTLSSSVTLGDVVTLSYTKPASNPVESEGGDAAASISTRIITNNVTTPAPTYVSSVIQNATPKVLEISFSASLNGITPPASAFTVLVNSASKSVSFVAVSGSKVTLTLSGIVETGDAVTVAYKQPSSNQLKSATGALVESFTAQDVTNNVLDQANTPPEISITSPADNNTYTAPASFAITADAVDDDGSVVSVDFYYGSILLGSSSVSPYSCSARISAAGVYLITAVATDNKGARTTSDPISITVTSTSGSGGNLPPVIAIASPAKGKTYNNPANIELSAVVSDADGYVTKVEFFDGDTKLTELTSEPYSWVWKGITTGTYKIKAVATDNQNATDTSAVVELIVGPSVTYDNNSNLINLYPNPNNGSFTVDFLTPVENEKNLIIISDMSGNKIQSEEVYQDETSKTINLNNPKTGLYILTLISNDIIVTKKIIVK